jgi:hypothetical protein
MRLSSRAHVPKQHGETLAQVYDIMSREMTSSIRFNGKTAPLMHEKPLCGKANAGWSTSAMHNYLHQAWDFP